LARVLAEAAVAPGFEERGLEATGVPDTLVGVPAEGAVLGVEETAAPGLVAGVELVGLGVTPAPEAAGAGDLANGVFTGAEVIVGLLVDAVDDGTVCLGAAFVGFATGADPAVAGFGAGAVEAGF
jgi:hypothetical protein